MRLPTTPADPLAELARWARLARDVLELSNGVAAFQAILSYLFEVTDAPPERVQTFVKQLGARAEEAYMTGAQILEARGEARGEAKGEAKVLLTLLARKFGPVPQDIAARVQTARIEELDRWVERVLDAKSLDDVFKS